MKTSRSVGEGGYGENMPAGSRVIVDMKAVCPQDAQKVRQQRLQEKGWLP